MTFPLGSACPDFTAQSLQGAFQFHAWLGSQWALVFSFKAMSPTCSTEFAALHALAADFADCDTQLLGISADTDTCVGEWLDDLQDMFDCRPSFTLINDPTGTVPRQLSLVDATAVELSLPRTAYLVSPDRRIAMTLTYPVTNGRNFAEILRTLKAIQLTAAKRVATSSTWVEGDPVMLPPSLPQAQAEQLYPSGVNVMRPYLRLVTLSSH